MNNIDDNQISKLTSILEQLKKKITKQQFNDIMNKIMISLKDCHNKVCDTIKKNNNLETVEPPIENNETNEEFEEIDLTGNKEYKHKSMSMSEIDELRKKGFTTPGYQYDVSDNFTYVPDDASISKNKTTENTGLLGLGFFGLGGKIRIIKTRNHKSRRKTTRKTIRKTRHKTNYIKRKTRKYH